MTLLLAQVTGRLTLPDNLTALKGTVTFTPGGGVLVDPADSRVLAGAVTRTLDATGAFTVPLPRTDNTGIQPAANTWNWYATFNLQNGTIAPFNFALTGPVDLTTVIQVAPMSGSYVITPGPTGHTPQVFGGAPAPSTLHTDGDLFVGTTGNVYQQVAGAWGSALANIQGPAGAPGSGGARLPVVKTSIKLEIIILPTAASWRVVTTSGSVAISAKIAAVAGDIVVASPRFLRSPATPLLDVVMLDSAGAISVYGGSDTGTPLVEGDPEMYPQGLNFPQMPGLFAFTVGAGHIDGGGFVTIALAYQGTTDGSQKIYAHPDYPFWWTLINYGQ